MNKHENKYIISFFIAAVFLIFVDNIGFQLISVFLEILGLFFLDDSKWFNNLRKLLPLLCVFTWLFVFLGMLTIILNDITSSPERFTYFFDCVGINLHNKSKEDLMKFIKSVGFVYIVIPYFVLFFCVCIWSCIDLSTEKAKQSYSLPLLRIGLYVTAGVFLFLDVLQKMKIHIQWLVGIPEGLLVSLFSMYIAFDTTIYMYYKFKSENNSRSTAP